MHCYMMGFQFEYCLSSADTSACSNLKFLPGQKGNYILKFKLIIILIKNHNKSP